ncbi:MAG: hypothetical protein HYX53_16355 [Chloroflexi bacterium]|nr:hypothetical protein [Chloroflexota bacterium]
MSIQPVHVAKSRRGQLGFLVALAALLVAMGAWWTSASATFPATTTAIAASPATVGPGQTVTYTATLTLTSGATTGGVSFQFPAVPGFVPTGITVPGGYTQGTCETNLLADGQLTGSECVSAAALTGGPTGTAYTFVVSGVASGAGPIAPVTATWADSDATTKTATTVGNVVIDATAGNSVSPVTALNAVGVAETFTFTLLANVTCASDTTNDSDVECTPADVGLTGGLTLLSGPTVADGDIGDPSTVSVTVINNSTGTGTVLLHLKQLNVDGNLVAAFDSAVGTKTYAVAELRHMGDTPDGNVGTIFRGDTFGGQDVVSNVRGSRHVVCSVQADTGIKTAPGATTEIAPVAIQIPLNLPNTNINVVPGGGYNGLQPVGPQSPTFTDPQIFTGNGDSLQSGGNGGLDGASCFSWVSTGAGDQEISVSYVGADGVTPFNVNWDTNANGNNETKTLDDANIGNGGVRVNRAIIKEWNVLENSTVTLSGGATGTVTGNGATGTITRNIVLTLNPATGQYVAPFVNISDVFNGSHVTRANNVITTPLAGVNWTAALSGCGSVSGDLAGTTALSGESVATNGTVINTPALAFSPLGSTNCTPGSTATITFTGSEPGPQGSGVGLTVTETVNFTFSVQVSQKKVLLAWVGQRIIIEADWRIPAGDLSDGDPVGVCPMEDGLQRSDAESNGFFDTTFIKGSGPGNFVAGLNDAPGTGKARVLLNGSDEAVVVDQDAFDSAQHNDGDSEDDIPLGPQDSCISRVLFESEDPGQVDIEAFVTRIHPNLTLAPDVQFGGQPIPNVTKRAFVIYYMKFESVKLSLVTQVSKGALHNATNADFGTPGAAGAFTAGNPWDVTKDDADGAADWNVSKDLLVRGRVSGWFVNENPSGRPQDATDPYNVLPENRWVMPIDWAMLAGGPKDNADGSTATGTAEQFRPYYDIMIDPSQTTWALGSYNGVGCPGVQSGSVTTNALLTNTGATFAVTSISGINAGTSVCLGGDTTVRAATPGVITDAFGNVVGLKLTVNPALGSAPAAGTQVFIATGVPFEGPLSLIDICDAAPAANNCLAGSNGGNAGAALANSPSDGSTSFTRDTMLRDGDVDMWDAPMPETPVSVKIRGTGFIKQVLKQSVYYLGTPNVAARANGGDQTYPNPYYITNIPGSPFIPAVVSGGGFLWDSWGDDGPGGNGLGVYQFWQSVKLPSAISTSPVQVTSVAAWPGGATLSPLPTSTAITPVANGNRIFAVASTAGLAVGQPIVVGATSTTVSAMGSILNGVGGFLGFYVETAATLPAVPVLGTPVYTVPTGGSNAGVNSQGIGDATVSTTDLAELNAIRAAYVDPTISRDMVVFSDNHGEFMVIANGDFKTDLSACAANTLGGGKQCKQGDAVGKGTITATADYPDFRGKHFPVASNNVVVTWTWAGYKDVTVENDPAGNTQFKYVVFHALDRDGFCAPTPGTGMVLLHPVLSSEDAVRTVGLVDPVENVDFLIDSGDGIIVLRSGGQAGINDGKQFATGIPTYSTLLNDPASTGIIEFPLSPLAAAGAADECQAWVKISNSLLGIVDVLVIAKDDEGNIGFDKIIDLQGTASFTLNFRWSLITWTGADKVPVSDALAGKGANDAGNDISGEVTAVYGWDAPGQNWLGYFPNGVNVPGANDLVTLTNGAAYWIAINGPGSVTWTIATNVGS